MQPPPRRRNQSNSGVQKAGAGADARGADGDSLVKRFESARAHLAALEESLSEVRAGLGAHQRHLQETHAERESQYGVAEEVVARENSVLRVVASEEQEICDQTEACEQRHAAIEAALASDLYWQWKEAFEAHMRRGGRFEDFPIDGFLREYCGAVPSTGLEARVAQAALLGEECSIMRGEFVTASSERKDLRMENSAMNDQICSLRLELASHESTTRVWWEDSLEDGSRANRFRGQIARLNLEREKLEGELFTSRRENAVMSDSIMQKKRAAVEYRAQFLPSHERITQMEEMAMNSECQQECARHALAKKETELGKHRLLQQWDMTTQRLDKDGYLKQREALSLLHCVAQEKEGLKNDEKQLSALTGYLRERQREAVALNVAYQQTAKLLSSTSKELQGLRVAHAELRSEKERVGRHLKVAEADAAKPGHMMLKSSANEAHGTVPRPMSASPSNLSEHRSQPILSPGLGGSRLRTGPL